MKLKKCVSMLIFAAMTLSFLGLCVSCKDGGSRTDGAGGLVLDPENPRHKIRENLPEKDYGGYEFRIIAEEWTASGELDCTEETGDMFNDAVYRRNQLVGERFGVILIPKQYIDK